MGQSCIQNLLALPGSSIQEGQRVSLGGLEPEGDAEMEFKERTKGRVCDEQTLPYFSSQLGCRHRPPAQRWGVEFSVKPDLEF